MSLKTVFFCIFPAFFLNVDSAYLSNKHDSSEEQKKEILESLKEFVDIVDQHNLNVTVLGSKTSRWSTGSVKEELAIALQMPVNEVHLKEPTLTDSKQKEYVTKLSELAKKENVSVKTRVVIMKEIEQGQRFILSEYLKNGAKGYNYFPNASSAILLNYIIKDPNKMVKRVEVLTAQILIKDLEISEGFPPEVLEESKKLLKKLWMAAEYESIIAELLVQQLDKKFGNNHQVVIGVEEFDLGEKKFAKLEIGESNVLIFIL